MNLAVKTYQYMTEKLAGIPDAWPADVRELGDDSTLPDQSGQWMLMTLAEFNAYKDAHQSDYDTWNAANAVNKQIAAARTGAIKRRSSWGETVVLEFRLLFAQRYMTTYSTQFVFDAMARVKQLIESGLLQEGANELASVMTIPLILDDWYDAAHAQTVRQYFSDRMLAGM